MVRETRHLWVGNLPDNIREERIREHFKRYGRVQSVKLLPRVTKEETGEITMACTVAFMDIKSASKAHNAELKIDDRTLNTEYYEPTDIPSAASPQNTPSPYSTSPGTIRFPNGHGSTDEHGSFPERFYERPATRVGSDGEFIRRTGYHETNRGRNRDRSYRNGPYIDRHRNMNNSWTAFDVSAGSRYNNSTGGSSSGSTTTSTPTAAATVTAGPLETGYSTTTPTENSTERRNSDQGAKKKTKSRSGSRSVTPSGSTSSRSPSRSRSRSSSSSSSSTSSRDTSPASSPKSRRQNAVNATGGNTSSHQPVTHSEDRRPLAICVKNLPLRSSDTSLKDGLFHEYKKHGKVTWVKVVGQSAERYAIVCFKKPEDVEKALEVSYDKSFFGCKIEVAPYVGYDVEDNDQRPYEAEIDEYHPKATRTLFIGNLEKDVTASDLRKHFDQFGEIIEIDIKKQGVVSSYAFCQYADIVSVVKAIRKMDGEHLGNNRIKLGFGKSMPTNCVWVDGVGENVTEKYLRLQFESFGVITKLHVDRDKGQALIFYDQLVSAQQAVNKMRGFNLKNNKIQVDFASRECQESFFENLEKQGTVLDRGVFEERRDSTSRTFESNPNRFSRYDTPTRPRTSSYSSRSSAATSQVTSAVPSPGTPGSVTPRGTGSRSRIARFDYYEAGTEYTDARHFRNYDEYSQGSAASHEENYEPEYPYNAHESPSSHLDAIEARSLQSVEASTTFAPPDIRNLQKERVHLLEQLEECPSSGDEVMSPKKRLKLDLLDSTCTSDVIIEANRDHRKVMEVRRFSDATINKHHSRRPSIDSGKHISSRDVGSSHERYVPHAICKRRKTGSSDSGSRVHHYDHSGSESVGGSRPGTPLCDERPENFQPSEPRRIPRDRERDGILSLPLPRFAAQLMNRGSVSVAGIKGQKDNILSSPPAAVTSPRISNPRPPSPVHVPPPASPPPRPPSLSSNSSDSDINPPSPSLEERIRSLDEKYEKWSGSRTLSAAGNDALAMLDANLEKFRSRHKLLDLDLKEVQPSENLKSVMAKRSVFDEDLKRLENVGEKYEPKEFTLFPRVGVAVTTTTAVQTTVPATSLLSALPKITPTVSAVPQLPKTPTMLSPRSTGSTIPAAKGLQYPFPSHPPTQATPSAVPSSPATPSTPPSSNLPPSSSLLTSTGTPLATTATSSSTTSRSMTHGDNRLKPCPSASSDINRTSSKVNVNRTIVSSSSLIINNNNSSTSVTTATSKTINTTNSEKNIPQSGDLCSSSSSSSSSGNSNSVATSVTTPTSVSSCAINNNDNKFNKNVRDFKLSDKGSEKVIHRRDSAVSSGGSPRAEIRARRNSDTNIKRTDDNSCDSRSQIEDRKKELRLEKVRLENERLERERLEKERVEKERVEKERQEKEKQEKERLEKERLERESELERQRLEKERLEKEKLERERVEKERIERERRREREEQERREREERERKEREERERKEREEKLERERKEREEREKREAEDKERLEKEKVERERKREEERRHKDENHEKRKDEHRHRENHSESKHSVDKTPTTKDLSKDEKSNHEISSKHEARNHEKNRHQSERDARKEGAKENRENNIHDKHNKNCDIKETKDRAVVESRHMSIDVDKSRAFENSLINRSLDPNKRKERNNSLPAGIGNKRRLSSHETTSEMDEIKRIKLSQEHKKLSERRDSKDSTRSEEKSKSKHKNNSISKSHDKHNSGSKDDEKRQKEREERHKNKQHKMDKQKSKSKSREKESRESPSTPKSPLTDKDFLARLDLRSTEEMQQHQQKREKEKRPSEEEKCRDKDEKKLEDVRRKDKSFSSDKSKVRDENSSKSSDERKSQKKDRIRKMTQNSVDNTDSDEPKKHSIFDIVDDEPAYISMYDKVKARSCKNMQKQEEEKRQEKIKATFSQLKQSRAKREEKKRSTSWDEDSDSDRERMEKSEMKIRRIPKIIASSDEEAEDRKQRKKKVIYTDSDSDRHRVKSELADTSEDGRYRIKNQQFKTSKSRITSDTSEDEIRKIKAELWSSSDNDNDQGFADAEEKFFKYKEQMDRLKKKEKRNNKHSESISEQIFGDSNSPITEIKQEKFNNRHSFGENTSDDEVAEMKRERSESRKKHKKKQKRQKHSISSEDSCKMEMESVQSEGSSEKKHHDKKKQHNKKDKKRDKTKEERDKSKKSKKNKFESKADVKRDGKMENIFGSLSEDSDNDIRETDSTESKSNSFHNKFEEINKPNASICNSESEHETKPFRHDEKEREKEEHKKRKEKKRREKERRLQEAVAAEFNENSMDFADMGKQLEANIKDESNDGVMENIKVENIETTEDSFRFNDHAEMQDVKKEDRKEQKEKKKKRKKSKEEKQKHHHHHHHDRNKVKSPEIKKEILPVEEIKVEIEEPRNEPKNQSLPNISDIGSDEKSSPNFSISPIGRESIISPIPKTPTSSKDKKRDKLIPCFGGEVDEKVHESAVKSISEFDEIKKEVVKEEEVKTEKEEPLPPPPEEKPRTIISQEETEDAVAALLGESFGENQFEECIYNEDTATNEDTSTNLAEETLVQDDEEMRQAVQSLNTPDLDVKPDTPQSENELQIDTDTEEQEEISLRFDQPPKTPDMAELLKPPKTPDIPSYMRNNEEKISTLIVKPSNASIGSPPSLTPIVAVAAIPSSPPPLIVTEVKKVEVDIPKNLPVLQDQQRTVISQSWSSINENLTKSEPSVIIKTNETTSNAIKAPSIVKISEPTNADSLQPLKLSLITEPSKSLPILSPTSSLHNMPARSPVQIKQHSPNLPNVSTTAAPSDSNLLSPKILNRLPITPVVVSKPLHAVILQPQTKMAHSLEPPKLVSTFEPRPQEKLRMAFPTSALPTYSTYSQVNPKVAPPPLVRPQELLNPKPISTTYNFVGMTNVPPTSTLSDSQRVYPIEKEKDQSTVTTTRSLPIPLPPPSIIVSATPENSTSTTLAQKSAVIQETITAKSPAPPVCQQQTTELPSTSQPVENLDHNQLKVVSEVRTSTPSPVIVANVKEATSPLPNIPKEIAEPKKLAIETVTDELNLSLEKTEEDDKPKVEVKENVIKEEQEENKTAIKEENEIKKEVNNTEESVNPMTEVKEQETVSVIKEVDKFDEEKADTESIISDISKERSSADILTKDDPLDNKEDSDYWSAKEVNIDSVIKTLCSADELSNHSSEHGSKDEWFDEHKEQEPAPDTTSEAEKKEKDEPPLSIESKDEFEPLDEGLDDEEKDVSVKCSRPRGRGRGRKPRGCAANIERGGIQTRRGGKISREPVSVAKRGGRGGRGRSDRRSTKSESESSADVYEFRDDSDESNANKERPRLILTIKSPAVSSANNNQTTAVVKEITKDGTKEITKEPVKEPSPGVKEEPVPSPQADSPASNASTSSKTTDTMPKNEDFISPASNTRKSRRLQERDGSKNSVDDTIEDVVKNTIQTRAAAAQNAAAAAAAAASGTPRRSGRQVVNAKVPATVLQETPRKSPRGRKKDRRNSDATDDSSEEKSSDVKDELPPSKGNEMEKPVVEEKVEKAEEVVKEPLKEKPMESLKAAMLRRIKGEMNHEPTNLIDPVTGLLIPMRESGEEGRYVPLPGSGGNILVSSSSSVVVTTMPATVVSTAAPSSMAPSNANDRIIITSTTKPTITCEPIPKSVITPPQSVAPATVTVIPQQSKPQSLKAHVLSSQAAKEIVSQQQTLHQQIAMQHQQQQQCKPINLQPTSVPQPVVVSMTKPQIPPPPINQHLNVNVSMQPMLGNLQPAHLSPRIPTSAMHTINMSKPLKVKPPQISPSSQITAINQKHILTTKPQSSSAQIKPMLPTTPTLTPIPTQTLINNQMAHIKTISQPPTLKQQIIITKSPITKPAHSLHSQQQQIMTGAVASTPPPLGVLKTQAQLNPARIMQGPAIATAKNVMEPPKIEVPLSNVILGQRSALSPQGTGRHVLTNYEANLGDAIAHFPIRSHDLTSAYQAMQYHQFFRQQGYHLPRSPMMPGGLEKLGDGQEGEEAPVTSPPLELRRPGSVGLGLSGRGSVVPHSLHSPHDRATDSPQVGQIYNVHSSRLPHHAAYTSRHYEPTEPPPAHRPLTSHSSLAALGSDRPPISHMTALGTPDRPLSAHLQPERPLSAHVERPLSGHGMLGPAGNLIGPIERHTAVAVAPASQQRLQAATPPHASQVPAQGESLFSLLKQYPIMWQGLLTLKNDQAAVQMYLISGNDEVAKRSLPKNLDGSTPPLRIFQRMRLEPPQIEGVTRKMQVESEHCMLLALPCGHDHADVVQQSSNLWTGFINYLQQKQAAGIINVAAPGTTSPPAYVVHIFPSCDFVTDNLRRLAPSLLHRVEGIAHLLIVITTV